MSKVIVVKSCATCPFFCQTTLGVVAAIISGKAGEHRLMGECGCPVESGLMHFPMGAPNVGEVVAARERMSTRLKIFDGNALPVACPMHREPVQVTIQVGGKQP